MTEEIRNPTRYFTFKLDDYIGFLNTELKAVLIVIGTKCQPEGPTFEDLVNLTGLGPHETKAYLKVLFNKNYIITNHQIATLKEKQGIDALKLRTYPHSSKQYNKGG